MGVPHDDETHLIPLRQAKHLSSVNEDVHAVAHLRLVALDEAEALTLIVVADRAIVALFRLWRRRSCNGWLLPIETTTFRRYGSASCSLFAANMACIWAICICASWHRSLGGTEPATNWIGLMGQPPAPLPEGFHIPQPIAVGSMPAMKRVRKAASHPGELELPHEPPSCPARSSWH